MPDLQPRVCIGFGPFGQITIALHTGDREAVGVKAAAGYFKKLRRRAA